MCLQQSEAYKASGWPWSSERLGEQKDAGAFDDHWPKLWATHKHWHQSLLETEMNQMGLWCGKKKIKKNSIFTFSALPNIFISINSIWLETTWIAFQGIQFISFHIFWESNPWPSFLMLCSTVSATRTLEQTWMLLSQLCS